MILIDTPGLNDPDATRSDKNIHMEMIKNLRMTFLIFQYTALCQWFSRSNKGIRSESSQICNILFPSIENNRPYRKVHSIPECHNKESRYYTLKYQSTQKK